MPCSIDFSKLASWGVFNLTMAPVGLMITTQSRRGGV